MNKSTRAIFISIIGIFCIITTFLCLYLLEFIETNIDIMSVCFLLLSQALLFASLLVNTGIFGRAHTMQKIGLPVIASLYMAATLLSAVFFKLGAQNGSVKFKTALVIEIAIMAITGVIAAAVILFSDRAGRQEEGINEKRRLVQICEKRISDLLSANKNKPGELQLVLILEKLKYCDKIGASSVDEKIVGAIIRLENELSRENPNADGIFGEINALISQRNSEMADSKRGGF